MSVLSFTTADPFSRASAYVDDDTSNLVDRERLAQFEEAVLVAAGRLGFAVTQFMVVEDRTTDGPPPKVTIQLEQGPSPNAEKAREFFLDIGAKVTTEETV
jgi:hypothetical protein